MIWYVAKALLGLVATLLIAAVLIYGGSVGAALVGNLGTSSSLNASVGALIAGRLAVTVPLAVLAGLVAVVVGGLVGWFAGQRPGSWVDRGLSGLAQLGIAVPGFWLGMLLVLLFAATLRWLPPGGFIPWSQNFGGALASLLLPVLALALPQAGALALLLRDALARFTASAYSAALQGRGLSRSDALWQHGIRNVLPEVLAALGPVLSGLIAGALVVENIFYLPGLGRLVFDALSAGDLPLLRGTVLIVVLLIAGTLFLIRLSRMWADPRLLLESDA